MGDEIKLSECRALIPYCPARAGMTLAPAIEFARIVFAVHTGIRYAIRLVRDHTSATHAEWSLPTCEIF